VDGILSAKKNADFPQRITPRPQTKVGMRMISGQFLKKNYDRKSWTSWNFCTLLSPTRNVHFGFYKCGVVLARHIIKCKL
jgi:hypothetical protein